MNGFYSFVIGWGVLITLFYAGSKFEGSRTIIYYILWLSVVLVLVTESHTLQSLIAGTGLPTSTATEQGPTA